MDIQFLEKQLNRLMVSVEDFHEATIYLEAIENSTSSVLYRAAILAAVVAYCRPFCKSKPGKEGQSTERVSLGLEKLLNCDEMILHKKLKTYRNTVLAHSDFDYRPAHITNKSPESWGYITAPAEIYFSDIALDQFKKLAVKIWQACRIRANEIQNKLAIEKA